MMFGLSPTFILASAPNKPATLQTQPCLSVKSHLLIYANAQPEQTKRKSHHLIDFFFHSTQLIQRIIQLSHLR